MLAFEWPFCRIWEAAEFEMEGLDDSPSKCSPQAVLSCTKTLVESAAKKVHTACTAFGHLLSSAGRSALLQLQASCSAVLGLLQQCSQALGSGTQALGSGMLKCVTDLLSATGSALAAALSHTKATMSACTAGSTAAVGSAFCSALTCVRELLIQAMSSIGSACQAMVKSPAWCLAGTANCLTATKGGISSSCGQVANCMGATQKGIGGAFGGMCKAVMELPQHTAKAAIACAKPVAGCATSCAKPIADCAMKPIAACAKPGTARWQLCCPGGGQLVFRPGGTAMPAPTSLPPPMSADGATTPRSAFTAASNQLVSALSESVRREGELTNKIIAVEAARAKELKELAAMREEIQKVKQERDTLLAKSQVSSEETTSA
jgi:hypothetical protein